MGKLFTFQKHDCHNALPFFFSFTLQHSSCTLYRFLFLCLLDFVRYCVAPALVLTEIFTNGEVCNKLGAFTEGCICVFWMLLLDIMSTKINHTSNEVPALRWLVFQQIPTSLSLPTLTFMAVCPCLTGDTCPLPHPTHVPCTWGSGTEGRGAEGVPPGGHALGKHIIHQVSQILMLWLDTMALLVCLIFLLKIKLTWRDFVSMQVDECLCMKEVIWVKMKTTCKV